MIGRLTPFYTGESAHLVYEIEDRLAQLEFLRDEVLGNELQWIAISEKWYKLGSTPGANADEVTQLGAALADPIKQCCLFAESFYLIAFRIIDAVRHLNQQLGQKPKLVAEPMGIIRLRNALIIHPDKPLPVVTRSFSPSLTKGLSMDALRLGGNADNPDAGFHANAGEFRDFLIQWSNELTAIIGFPWDNAAST